MRRKFGPVRDQSTLSWCYAFAAADLLDQYYGRSATFDAHLASTGNSFSAADIALSYNRGQKNFPWDSSGDPSDAIREALRRGICKERDLSSERVANFISSSASNDLRRELVEINSRFRQARQTRNCAHCVATYMNEVRDMFPRISETFLREILLDPTVESKNLVYILRDENCRKRTFVTQRPAQPQSEETSQASRKLDEVLESGKAAIIRYKPQFMMTVPAGPNAMHISVIVGRRPSRRGCEYLIRNSWGPSCSSYKPEFKCDLGNIWVPAATLNSNTNHVTWLE